MADTKNRPVHQIRLGAIQAAIWLNRFEKTGESWYAVTVSRSYRVEEQLKDTKKFFRDDLPILSKAIEMAYAWIWEQSAPGESEAIE